MRRLLYLLPLLFFLSCLSPLVKSAVRSTHIPNWIYIHENPQVGDYAVHGTAQEADIRYEVYAVSEDSIEVSQRFIDTGFLLGSGLDEFEVRALLDRQGFVQEAYLLQDDGRKTRLPVAGPGQNGHIGQISRFKSSGLLHVEAGYFAVTEVRAFEMWTMKGLLPGKVTVVHYGNPEVPFGVVKIAGYDSGSLTLVDLTDFLAQGGAGLAVGLITKHLEGRYMNVEATLLEHGNSVPQTTNGE